jgi:hypothetical protein
MKNLEIAHLGFQKFTKHIENIKIMHMSPGFELVEKKLCAISGTTFASESHVLDSMPVILCPVKK